MLRSLVLYTALIFGANAAFAGPIDIEAARAAGMIRLVESKGSPPEARYLDEDGHEVTLADHAGQALVVNFWATWCAPCREEMPSLAALQEAEGGTDFQVLTIASGRNKPAAIDRFFDEIEVTGKLPKARDPKARLAREMGVAAMPVTILIDRDGLEVARLVGGADWSSEAALTLIRDLKSEARPEDTPIGQ